ncbi:MAG: DNA-binding response OmpR family regulator [Candidatus Latescibacterota bacterium]|jgi:DNA-binding response OmpR family regulator
METILVSEKQSHLRQLLEWELSDANFTCICVESSDQATEVMMVEKIDAVVIGMAWPPEDDLHMLCWLKKFYTDVPVVLFAGEEELRPKSIARLADAWVEKSSRIDLLITEVRHLVAKFSLPVVLS